MSDELKRKITDLPLVSGVNRIDAQDKLLLEKVIREHAEKAGAGARAVANAKVPAKYGDDFIDIQVRIPVGKGLTPEARQKIADELSIFVRWAVDGQLDRLRHLGELNS